MGLGLPDIGDVVTIVLNKFAQALWGFFGPLLSAVFAFIDQTTRPTIVYTPDGPLAKVFPITLWLGLMLAIGLGFAQIGLAVVNGSRSLFALLKGTAQYMLLSGSSLVILAGVSSLASLTATGIIEAGYGTKGWSGLSEKADFGEKALNGLTGIGLLVVVLFNAIPFTLGLLTEMVIRLSAMQVLAATFPIVAAGLVHEKFARWYWTALRWMLALIFVPTLIAISMVIGHSMGQGAGSVGDGMIAKALQAFVSGLVALASLLWPYFLFKLFAFIDPNTVAGANFRAAMPTRKSGGGGDDSEGAKQQSEGEGDNGAGAVERAGMAVATEGGSELTNASSSGSGGGGGGGSSTSSLSTASAGALGAMGSAIASYGSTTTGASQSGATQASESLDAAGAGHAGGRGRGGGASAGEADADAGAMTGPNGGMSGSSTSSSPGGSSEVALSDDADPDVVPPGHPDYGPAPSDDADFDGGSPGYEHGYGHAMEPDSPSDGSSPGSNPGGTTI